MLKSEEFGLIIIQRTWCLAGPVVIKFFNIFSIENKLHLQVKFSR